MYELTLLVKNSLEEKARKQLLDDVTKNFGKLIKEDLWGIRSLSYPIKHQDKAYFAFYEFESEPSKIPSLDKMIKLNEDIIRYLLLKSKVKKLKIRAKKTEESKTESEEKLETEAKE